MRSSFFGSFSLCLLLLMINTVVHAQNVLLTPTGAPTGTINPVCLLCPAGQETGSPQTMVLFNGEMTECITIQEAGMAGLINMQVCEEQVQTTIRNECDCVGIPTSVPTSMPTSMPTTSPMVMPTMHPMSMSMSMSMSMDYGRLLEELVDEESMILQDEFGGEQQQDVSSPQVTAAVGLRRRRRQKKKKELVVIPSD